MKLRVSPSALADTAVCTTRVALHHLGYRSRTEGGPQFAGSAGHLAMEAWLKSNGSSDVAIQVFDDSYRPWADAHAGDLDERLQADNCEKILKVYFRRKAGQLSWRALTTEEPFEVPLDEGVYLIGVFDVRAVWDDASSIVGQGQDCIVEHKFTGRITSLWTEGYIEDPQLTAYWYAHRTLYPDRPLFSIVVNAIEFSRLPLSDRVCHEHGRPFSSCYKLGTHARFEQFLTQRDPDQVEAWRANAVRLANRYRKMITLYDTLEKASQAPQEGKFVRGSQDIGCRGCDFQAYCFARRPVRQWEAYMSRPSDESKRMRSGLTP